MNLNFNSYISLKTNLSNQFNSFLIDTGADISLLKINFLKSNVLINSSNVSFIKGIGDGSIPTHGTVDCQIFVKNIFLKHNLHIVDEDFPIPCSGILGLDFLKTFNCVLDYENNTLSFPKYRVKIPIMESPCDNSLSLPARCETIRRISIKTDKLENQIFIPNQEISPGIFVAQCITIKDNAYVRILNTTTENKFISHPSIKYENLSNFNVFQVNNKNTSSRNEILKRLSKNFPSFVQGKLTNLCSEFSDVFSLETDPITFNNFYKQELRLKDDNPVFIKNYRIPHAHKPIVDKEVEKLLKNDLIEPSFSEYNSPVLLVPKKSLPGSSEKRWRLVIDYRQINKKLVADKFPLPRIDEILDQLGRAKYFSCLDLVSGFHQIELEDNSRDITSFTTDKGIFRFKRLPYGLKVAPNSFQRMMTLAFSGLSPSQAFLYMDDLVVIACSENQMIKNLTDVFQLCRKYNLKLHPDKCTFFSQEVTYLGHKCTNKGILPDTSKFELVQKYPTPTDGESARRFVAFCNYYRRFIPNFSEYAYHLNCLTRKKAKFIWSDKCEQAFQYLKNSLIKSPILQYPDFEKQFCITTDASNISCGAILSQEYNGIQLPVNFASRTFTKGEQNKSVIERELAAIHWAIQYFKPYIFGNKFLIKTDHRPLTYLFSMKNPSSKLCRMRLDLEEYDFEIEYIKGSQNCGADALSRIDFSTIRDANEINQVLKVTTRSETRQTKTDKHIVKNATSDVLPKNVKIYEVNNFKEVNKLIRLKFYFTEESAKVSFKKGRKTLLNINLIEYYKNGKLDLGQFFPRLEREAISISVYELQLSLNDLIFERIRIQEFKNFADIYLNKIKIALTPKITYVHTSEEINNIIKEFHDNPILGGHPGRKRLLDKIKTKYFWKKMSKDVSNYVKSCHSCKINKPINKSVENMIITPTPQKAFDIVLIDTIGPMIRSDNGNEYALTLICDLTKYLVSIPIPNKSAKVVAKAIFENFILLYGPMKTVLTDMGSEYMNQVFKEILELLKIQYKSSTAYHHQTLGTIERSHRTFNEYLRSYIDINRTDWDEWLKYFTYCFNTTPSTTHEYCPFQLVFGKIPSNFDFLSPTKIDPVYNFESYLSELKFRLQTSNLRAQRILEKHKQNRKEIHDKSCLPLDIKIDDLVLLENTPRHKHESVYKGPFKVIDVNIPNCTLLINNKRIIVHKDRLRKY